MEDKVIISNPSRASNRYPVTQAQIDDILENELKGFDFPIKPVYNPRIKDNGRIIAEVRGQVKKIKKIEIGKQDKPERKFLIDTILHEYYESEILIKRLTSDIYLNLDNALALERHKWIDSQISSFFSNMEDKL